MVWSPEVHTFHTSTRIKSVGPTYTPCCITVTSWYGMLIKICASFKHSLIYNVHQRTMLEIFTPGTWPDTTIRSYVSCAWTKNLLLVKYSSLYVIEALTLKDKNKNPQILGIWPDIFHFLSYFAVCGWTVGLCGRRANLHLSHLGLDWVCWG